MVGMMKEVIIGIIILVPVLSRIVGRGGMFGMIIVQCVTAITQLCQFHINEVHSG